MRICLFEDRRAADLGPVALTRPVADLLCGLTTVGAKQRRFFAPAAVGFLVRPYLADLAREAHPNCPVNDPAWVRAAPAVLVNARWVPPRGRVTAEFVAGGPVLAVCKGEPAFAVLDPRQLAAVTQNTIDDCLADWCDTLPRREVGGFVANRPWDYVERNADQIAADFPDAFDPEDLGGRPASLHLVGPAGSLFVHPSAVLDPLVVADTRNGPVVVAAGAVVKAFSRLEGPCYVGPGTHVLGAQVKAGATLGPQCRIGGEVEAAIIQGYSNKAHDGFLGHSFVGEWVNLGAGTTTGNLRTDYGPISVPVGGSAVPTGRMKVGSFIGDHAKTGLSVLFNCGTTVGPFAGVLPTGKLAPREVPAFCRAGPNGLADESDVDAALIVADRMMRRREKSVTRTLEAVYRAVAAQTAADRARALAGPPDGGRLRRAG